MGVFALASRGCVVESLGRRVRLTPRVFVGESRAKIEHAPFRHGTSVSFPLPVLAGKGKGTGASEMAWAVRDEALYCPIEVTFNGQVVERRPFLEHALAVVSHEGVEIGIYDRQALRKRTIPPRRSDGERSLNFGGHAVRARQVVVRDGDNAWTALWDVKDGARGRLWLPTREAVIADGAWRRLVDATRLAIYRHVASLPSHRLSVKDVRTARRLGVAIPDPPFAPLGFLSFFTARMAAADRLDDPDAREAIEMAERAARPNPARCVLTGPLPDDACLALFSALRRADDPPLFVLPDAALVGLPAYESLRSLVGVGLSAVLESGQEFTWDMLDPDERLEGEELALLHMLAKVVGAGHKGARPMSLGVTVTYEGDDGREERFGPVPVPFVCIGHPVDEPRQVRVLATRAMRPRDAAEAAREIAAVLYEEDDLDDRHGLAARGEDPPDPDAEAWLDEMREIVEWACPTPEGAAVLAAHDVGKRVGAALGLGVRSEIQSVSMRIERDPDRPERTRVTITVEDGSGQKATRTVDVTGGPGGEGAT